MKSHRLPVLRRTGSGGPGSRIRSRFPRRDGAVGGKDRTLRGAAQWASQVCMTVTNAGQIGLINYRGRRRPPTTSRFRARGRRAVSVVGVPRRWGSARPVRQLILSRPRVAITHQGGGTRPSTVRSAGRFGRRQPRDSPFLIIQTVRSGEWKGLGCGGSIFLYSLPPRGSKAGGFFAWKGSSFFRGGAKPQAGAEEERFLPNKALSAGGGGALTGGIVTRRRPPSLIRRREARCGHGHRGRGGKGLRQPDIRDPRLRSTKLPGLGITCDSWLV